MINNTILHLFERYPELGSNRDEILATFEILLHTYKQAKKVLIAGNGGSAADSEHIVGELMKGFCKKRPLTGKIVDNIKSTVPVEQQAYYLNLLQTPLEAISLVSQSALITAFANDVSADLIFAQQVLGYGKEGDVLMVLTTSGNSKNVIHASWIAKSIGVKVIALTSREGGEIKDIADVSICVPASTTLEVQEYHLPIYHALCQGIEEDIFGAD